jgi:hypothetical protein
MKWEREDTDAGNAFDVEALLSEVDNMDIETLSVIRQTGSSVIPLRLKKENIDWNGRVIRAGTINNQDALINLSFAIYDLKDKYGFIIVLPFGTIVSIFNDDSCELATNDAILIQATTQKKIPLFYNKKLEVFIIPAIIMRIVKDNLPLITPSR